ncbi:tRNA dihydrouridine synthase DusB [candidate division KSB1 bacterium]
MKIGQLSLGEFPVVLAPLEDITDPPFRILCKRMGADLMYTEFISSEGLIRNAGKSTKKLDFDIKERPIGIQIFGHNVTSMIKAAQIAEEARPDLIDINFGCPVKKVIRKGAGAAMLKDIPLMLSITEAVVKAVKLPVTVKTRIGWDQRNRNIVEVAEGLQDTGISAISIHGRTAVQMYGGLADWTLIGEVKNNPRMHIPVIGNGDIKNPEIALEMKKKYHVDGIMIGRASIGYPWIFREIKQYIEKGELPDPPDVNERVSICKEHLIRSIEWKGEKRAVIEIRKHYSNYFRGLVNFKPFKLKLMQGNEMKEIESILDEIYNHYCN